MTEIKNRMESEVSSFIQHYCEENGLENIWKEPIIKYADAKNPMFQQFNQIVTEHHYIPEDFLPGATNVLSYFLPFQDEVAKSNVGGKESSALWANAYLITNKLAIHLNEHLTKMIHQLGYLAAIPTNIGFSKEELMSRWSQRHIAYLAGHGTFGLNNMLISEKGCAGRYFSIVTTLPVELDSIIKEERCLYKRTGTCKACVKKCPTGALTENGFDRFLCYTMCLENKKKYDHADVCGKCVVGLPCTFKAC